MNKLKNVWTVLSSLIIIVTAAIIICTDAGPYFVVLILAVSVFIYAVRQIGYYLVMARCMVGGTNILFKGIIALDFSIFFFSMHDVKAQYIMIYLIVIYIGSGAIDLFRAHEIKKLHNKSWKVKAVYGVLNIIISILCIIFINSYEILCLIYGVGLVIGAVRRISRLFVKNKMVYIQ